MKELFWKFKKFLIRLNTDEAVMKRRALRSRAIKLVIQDREREEEFLESIRPKSMTNCVGESLASYLNDSLTKRVKANNTRSDHRPVPRHRAITESVIRL
jgi:hypothetical protein